MLRCDCGPCHGPATVEIVALWATGDSPSWSHDSGDIVTVVGAACDDDRAALLAECRQWGAERGYTSPEGGPLRRYPLGVYVRVLDSASRIMT